MANFETQIFENYLSVEQLKVWKFLKNLVEHLDVLRNISIQVNQMCD